MKIVTLISTCLMVLAVAQAGAAAEWVKLGETKWGAFHYDKSSVKKGERFVTVTSKQMLRPEAAAAMAEALPNLAGVAYETMYDSIDCEKGLYIQDRVIYYNGNDRVIYDTERTKGQYKEIGPRPIPADTPIAWVADTVCGADEKAPRN
jgi:hypothetical protein